MTAKPRKRAAQPKPPDPVAQSWAIGLRDTIEDIQRIAVELPHAKRPELVIAALITLAEQAREVIEAWTIK